MIGHGISDFYTVQDAVPDAAGLIDVILLPLVDTVVYPNMVTPLFIRREQDITAIAEAQTHQATVVGVSQRDPNQAVSKPEDFYTVGTEMALGRLMHMPDGGTSVLAQGRRRVQIVEFMQTQPYFRVKARPVEEQSTQTREVMALMRASLSLFQKCVQLNPQLPEEAYIYALNVEEPGWLADLAASTLNLSLAERQDHSGNPRSGQTLAACQCHPGPRIGSAGTGRKHSFPGSAGSGSQPA